MGLKGAVWIVEPSSICCPASMGWVTFDILGGARGVEGVTSFIGLFMGVCGDEVMVCLEKPTSVLGPFLKM